MKLFDGFEAVRFPEENMIFITHDEFLYYCCDPKARFWRKHKNAGNDHLTLRNYPDVSKAEIIKAMHGVFPTKETDFIRLCNPSCLTWWDLRRLLEEDYSDYMSERTVCFAVDVFLEESVIHHKSYFRLKQLFDDARARSLNHAQILEQIKELSAAVIGRDIFREEIGIVDGHDSSSYFWIMPVRIIDYSNTDDMDNVAEMRSAEISIEENDVAQYLSPFLYKYFDGELEANKQRAEDYWENDDGSVHASYVSGFEWYLTYNFYTFEAVENIIKDIRDTMNALALGKENEYTAKLKEKRGFETHKLLYAKDLSEEQIKAYNDNRPKEDNTAAELIVDFYRRFLYRMEYMIRVGREKGYNLISFMGP